MSEIVLGGTILSVKQLWKKIGDKIFQYRFYKFADELRVNPDRCERGMFESAKKNLRIEKYPDTYGRETVVNTSLGPDFQI